jgi:hypothetical protein
MHTLQAQNPGGVSSSIELWLRAEDLATTATTSDWPDFYGVNDGLFHTSVGGGYGVSVNSINSNPTVIINDEWFESNANSNGNDLNVFVVYKLDQNNASLWGNDSSNTNGHDGRFATSQNVSRTNSTIRNIAANTVGDIYIHHTQIGASSGVYVNGTFNTLNESGTRSNNTNVNQRNFEGIFLGRKETDETSSGDIRDMEVAEFIVYDGVLTNADRERISSYLAIKYGVQIDAYNYVLSNGTTIWDRGVANTGGSNYNHNIAGIAKDGGSGLVQLNSRSEETDNLLTISTTNSNLGANSALVWGHNDEDTDDEVVFASTENFFMKGERMERIWQCQKEGTVGNVTITMEIPSGDLPNDFTTNNIVLLVSDDQNFTTNVQTYRVSTSGNNRTITNVSLNDEQYFTLARLDGAMWVKADATGNNTGGNLVSTLVDNIGGINNMVSGGGNRPTFVLGGASNSTFNFNPYVQFNQGTSGEYLEAPNFRGFGESTASTFLAVRRNNSNSPGDLEALFSYAAGSDDNEYVMEDPTGIDILVNNDFFSITFGHTSNFNIVSNTPRIIANIRGDNTRSLIRLDGFEDDDNYRNNDDIDGGGSFIFGQEQDNVGGGFNSSQEYNGDIAEAIVMSERVSTQDRQIIESYLAIKYGITLNNDYYLSNGTTRTWNRGANSGDYNNNIAGIGRDDFIQLNQVKSRSQNPTNVHVTIEKNGGNFPNDQAHLIWGCDTSDYDIFSIANAPTGVNKSEKIWYVQNNSNRIIGVNVIMDIPPSLAAQPGFLPVLLTSSSNNFSGATPIPGSIVNNEIVFSNVNLPNGSFFSLGVEEGIGFKNNDIGAPTSFEACPGSSISFVYNDFPTDPSFLSLTDTTGATITIPLNLISSNPSAGGVSGEVECIVPSTAGSGNIALLDANSIILYTRTNFIVHNPLIDFFPTRDPLCATDTARLIGIPLGGIFSSGNPSLYPGIVSNDSIVGLAANWNGVRNEIVDSVDVIYTYTPRYIDGTPCLNSIPKTKTIKIRDNRINNINYNYIITQTSPPTTSDRKLLDNSIGGATTNTLRDISPTIPGGSNFDFSFTGTYVQEDVNNNTYTFLTDQAVGSGTNSSFPVTLRYNNGGCIGEATNNIDVFPPLRFLGLADTLCREANPSRFGRDPLPEYRDTMTNENFTFGGTTINRNFHNNRIVSVIVDTNAHPIAFQRAIDTIRTVVNDELYSFDPNDIPDSIPYVSLIMVYQTTIETTTSTSSGTTRTRDTFDLIAFDTVYLEDRPVPQISGIDSFYCENAEIDTLRPSPVFETVNRTYFTLWGDNGFGFNTRDTLIQDTLFDFSYHYLKQVPNRDRNLPIQLVYTVDRYGCVDRDTAYTIIVAPVQAIIQNNSPYCTSDLPSTINVGYTGLPPTGGDGSFLSALGLDTTNTGFANFFPQQAGPGNLPIAFEYTDFYQCVSTAYDTLIVREPPAIQVIADQVGRNEFCANDSSATLETILLPSGAPANSPFYTGAGVFGNNFNPAVVFGPGGGTTTIQSEYTDSFGCKGFDTIRIQINAIPNLSLNGFNGVNSPTGAYDHKYCYNDSSFVISGSPSHLSGQGGNISGAGVVLIDSTYYYNPNFSGQNETTVNLVTYTFTDNKGCSNIDTALVLVDSIPETTLTGLDTAYCVNDLPVFAIGFPDTATFAGSSIYGGVGINPNTGSFDPSIAGVGRTILSYSFEDREGCANTAFDTIVVNPLPIPSFGGYDPQYCTADPNDTLESNNLVHPNSSFFFYGNLIIDSIGILSPDTSLIGVQTVFYSYTDSFGCTDIRGENIFIHPTPEVTVSGLDSAYCFNADKDIISIFPAPGFLTTNDNGFNYRGNTIEFTPSADTAGVKSFTYIYVDLATTCSDTISARTYVHKPNVPEYTGLDTTYCEIRDTFALNGLSTGGSFSGLGIIDDGNGNFSFSPAKASSGVHDITYQALDTFIYTGTVPSATLVCSVDTVGEVTVRPLPVPNIQTPVNNQRFCSSDTIMPIITNTNNSVLDTFFSDEGGILMVVDTILSTITVGGITYTVVDFDTTYSFNPATATIGTNIINYTVFNNFGCSDSIQYTYLVDGFKEAEFALDSVFCESEDSVVLFGVPSGGRFLRDNDTVAEPSFFVPNGNYVQGMSSTYIDSFLIDTMIYVVQDGACFSSDTQYVRINGVPRLVLEGPNPLDNYCLIDDTLNLNLQPMGGTLTGAGVLFNRSDMILSIAGAGVHTLFYTYQDSTTGCVNTATDTFRVYGQPQVDFAAIGGCQSDSIFFWPDNQILGLNNQFSNGQPIDSITELYWDFDGSGNILAVNGSNTLLDSFHHVYNTPGVYYPQLIVTNQNTCTDTASIRLVISPLIQNYPYDETFQTSNGDWYAEDRDPNQSQLWQWGTDNNPAGIDGGTNGNLFWETNLNSSYSINEDGWVYGPCFDLDTLNRPMIKLDYWSDSRENVDGTVLEYQQADGQWKPLGQIGNGINWYDTPIITGQPGDQNIAPIGWSGQTNGWTDARYRLDEFLTTGRALRMRVAFGSPAISLGANYYDGFAFDNVWVGDRTRNVLLETSSDITLSNMMRINNHVYSLIFNTELNKDVTLVQYNCCLGDEFYLDNIDITDKLNIVYGNSSPGKAYINGATNNIPPSLLLNKRNFEEDMLQDPKFTVEIDTFYTDAQNLTVTATVTARENLPMSNYRIHTIVTEDSLLYDGTLDMIQAVARKDDESLNTFNTDWIPGQWETVTLNWNHGSSTVNYNPNNFQVVVFIQDLTSREVFQVNSSRDVSGYLLVPIPIVGTDNNADQDALESIRNMKLYPNPSASYFQVDFDQPLEEEFQWRLVDMRGVEIQSGTLEEGAQDLRVENEALPTGMYIFTVQNGRVFSQKKVIINQK